MIAVDLDPQANLSAMFLDDRVLEGLWGYFTDFSRGWRYKSRASPRAPVRRARHFLMRT
jgi:cellulose biosynthesis protein BcsQ